MRPFQYMYWNFPIHNKFLFHISSQQNISLALQIQMCSYNIILTYSMCFVDINSENMCLLNHFSVDLQTSKLNIWPNIYYVL